MKILFLISVIMMASSVFADDIQPPQEQLEAFDYKIYTPEVVVDQNNTGKKGAVQLLWQKANHATRFEVEVFNGKTMTYSTISAKHFHHLMIYFNKEYRWRVREVSAKRTTAYTDWMPLKVMKAYSMSQDYQEPKQPTIQDDSYLLDTGD